MIRWIKRKLYERKLRKQKEDELPFWFRLEICHMAMASVDFVCPEKSEEEKTQIRLEMLKAVFEK